ncbi:zinc finger and BTB domain-containing protein 17-like isoform X10 [Pecten maximus]|uniref:zinc finger and BTB domain-containing protein 17-like isoform X10 n=1 Tax=Pecten maximus TaxID=6579 RepID=UPI001458B401|nr:zinc finger and BTB domain-containing protein 17-like isoform X10 [Pecten maximus]
MSSMNYQKVYMNQIHSSSLLCQLSHMWKSQMLCDAIIKTGQIITKAHRVVLVAACPMLQSMENASAGSHLEVRLAADIKQESVNTFLQYLYEGFMMLTEENVRDVEKVARLLQVDSVIKCCADFYKCMNAKTGAPFPGSAYKYSFSGHDLAEFRHVRATGLQKTASERIIKRVSDFPRPGSPGSKRPRLHRGGSPSDVTVIGSDKADDTASMSHSYMAGAPDPWDRVPKLGSGMGRQGATGRNSQPGVIEIVEESIELVQTEPPEKDSGQSSSSSSRSSQRSAAVSIAVTSQFNTEPDISVVNVFGNPDTQSSTPAAATNTITSSSSSRGSITVSPLTIFQDPHPPSSSGPEPPSSSTVDSSSGQDQQRLSEMQFSGFSQRQDMDSYSSGKQKSGDGQLSSTPQQRPFPMSMSPINQPKPFAAGSAMQAGMSSPSSMSLPLGSPSSSKSVQKPRSAPASPAERARDNRRASEAAGMQSTADMTPDLSIVKIEASNHETGGLDMHVDMPEEGVMRIHQGRMPDDQDDTSDKEIEDWAREEMSNEGSNISGDQNNSWYMGTFKVPGTDLEIEPDSVVSAYQPSTLEADDMLALQQAFGSGIGMYEANTGVVNRRSRGTRQGGNGRALNRKEHVCTEPGCDFRTSRIYNFQRHCRIHNDDAKLKCEICQKKFLDAYELKHHVAGHSGAFKCNLCDRSFASRMGFYEHTKFHQESDERFDCVMCGKTFWKKSRYVYHLRAYHNKVLVEEDQGRVSLQDADISS